MIQEACEKFGEVKYCNIDWDKAGISKETAIVEYLKEEDAKNAM